MKDLDLRQESCSNWKYERITLKFPWKKTMQNVPLATFPIGIIDWIMAWNLGYAFRHLSMPLKKKSSNSPSTHIYCLLPWSPVGVTPGVMTDIQAISVRVWGGLYVITSLMSFLPKPCPFKAPTSNLQDFLTTELVTPSSDKVLWGPNRWGLWSWWNAISNLLADAAHLLESHWAQFRH